MAFTNHPSRTWALRLKKESTFGSANSVASGQTGWITVPLEALPKIEGDVAHDDIMLSSTNRIKNTQTVYSNTENSTPTLPFRSLYRREYGGYLIAAALQTASPGNVLNTAYAHTWTPHSTQPDFSANAGYFYTAVLDAPVASKDELIKSAILSSLGIVITPPAKGKESLVMLDGVLWSPFARTFGNSFEATPSTPSTNFITGSKFSVTIDGGSALPVRSARINILSNPFKVPLGGAAASIGLGIPFWDLKLSLQLYYNSDTVDLVSGMQSGASYALVLGNGVATSEYESFAATMTYARLTNDPLGDDGGVGVLNCEFDLLGSAGSGALSIVTTDNLSTF